MPRFTVAAGRLICKDGKPFISIGASFSPHGGVSPCEADELTHIIAALLNRLGKRSIATTYLGGSTSRVK